jgi:hypothetical protein
MGKKSTKFNYSSIALSDERKQSLYEEFCGLFEKNIPHFHSELLKKLSAFTPSGKFRVVWQDYEEIVANSMIEFLKEPPFYAMQVFNNAPESETEYNQRLSEGNHVIATDLKSSYPDIEMNYKGGRFAIDVKSGEIKDGKISGSPAFDMGRLDSYADERLAKFIAEYSVTIMWSGREDSKVFNVFIEPSYQSVGRARKTGGVAFQLYSGKIRPKSWKEFDEGKNKWNTKAEFLKGLTDSRDWRRISFITMYYKELNAAHKNLVKDFLQRIDQGEDISIDPSIFDTK